MVERAVVLAKLATIDRCLTRLAEVRDNETTERSRLDIEDITVLNITRAAQATIDLATHVVTTEGFGLPDSVSASFTMLSKHEIIDDALAERLRKMVGFRNVAVHDCWQTSRSAQI